MKLSDWFIYIREIHSYTMFTRRIWLFYNTCITFISETSNKTILINEFTFVILQVTYPQIVIPNL